MKVCPKMHRLSFRHRHFQTILTKLRQRLQAVFWLWRGPAGPPAQAPGKVELLRRLLSVLGDLEKDLDASRDELRDTRQRIRSAIAASDFASYCQAVAEMDEPVAGTILNLIRQTHGLGESVPGDMLDILLHTAVNDGSTGGKPEAQEPRALVTKVAGLARG